jgi:hypothetical protein
VIELPVAVSGNTAVSGGSISFIFAKSSHKI